MIHCSLWDRYPSLGTIITSDKRGALAVKSHQRTIRKVPLATSDITEMVHFVASDTHLVRWCLTAYYVPDYSLNRGLDRAAGDYTAIMLKLPPPR